MGKKTDDLNSINARTADGVGSRGYAAAPGRGCAVERAWASSTRSGAARTSSGAGSRQRAVPRAVGSSGRSGQRRALGCRGCSWRLRVGYRASGVCAVKTAGRGEDSRERRAGGGRNRQPLLSLMARPLQREVGGESKRGGCSASGEEEANGSAAFSTVADEWTLGRQKDDEEMSQQHGGDVHCNREQAFGTWGEVEKRYAMWGPHIIERRGLELVGLD
jgi:hypothetical protein